MATGLRTWTAAIVAKGQLVGSSGWVLPVGYYRAVGDDNLGEGESVARCPSCTGRLGCMLGVWVGCTHEVRVSLWGLRAGAGVGCRARVGLRKTPTTRSGPNGEKCVSTVKPSLRPALATHPTTPASTRPPARSKGTGSWPSSTSPSWGHWPAFRPPSTTPMYVPWYTLLHPPVSQTNAHTTVAHPPGMTTTPSPSRVCAQSCALAFTPQIGR